MHSPIPLLFALFLILFGAGLAGTEESQEDGADEVDKETIHRLCPTYATDINSPLRHVRTRIYFTSESHVHSLVNVLRYSHLGKLMVAASL